MYTREFHSSIENEEMPQAVRLGHYIKTFINPSAFVDFGCSTGIYVDQVNKLMPTIPVVGLEFSKEAVEHAVCPGILECDLTQPIYLQNVPNTLGLCLEVLEHIDDSKCRPVLENITRSCSKLIFSAAIPGQGGTGHINCRHKIDWITRFHELGWMVDFDSSNHLLNYMRKGYHMGWFTQNAMVLIPYKHLPY